MVNYEKLLNDPKFWAVNNKELLVSPLYYGSRSLYKKPLNQGVRAILHGGEFIVSNKYRHLIPKKLKDAIRNENKKIQ